MKTPMQELIERLEYLIGLAEGTMYEIGLKSAKEQAESILEKEKEVMCEFADDYQRNCFQKSADDYFKETFNTKER